MPAAVDTLEVRPGRANMAALHKVDPDMIDHKVVRDRLVAGGIAVVHTDTEPDILVADTAVDRAVCRKATFESVELLVVSSALEADNQPAAAVA